MVALACGSTAGVTVVAEGQHQLEVHRLTNSPFTFVEIPAQTGGAPGLSFIVTHENVVIYSREVTKHNLLMLKSGHFCNLLLNLLSDLIN